MSLVQQILGEVDARQFIQQQSDDYIYEFTSTLGGRKWVARIVMPGGMLLLRRQDGSPYPNKSRMPVIEFYDATTHFFHGWGQFVTSYFVPTIYNDRHGGLDLMGHEPAWKLSSVDMRGVYDFIEKTLGPSAGQATDANDMEENLDEAYCGFNAQELNSNQPLPQDAATIYRTMHSPWALEAAQEMRRKFGINLWVDGTVTTGWRVLVHRADYSRAKLMFMSILPVGANYRS